MKITLKSILALIIFMAPKVWAGQHTGIGGLPLPPPVVGPNESPLPSATSFLRTLSGSSDWTSVQNILEAIKEDFELYSADGSKISIFE